MSLNTKPDTWNTYNYQKLDYTIFNVCVVSGVYMWVFGSILQRPSSDECDS